MSNASNVTRKVTSQEIAASEALDTDEAADQDLDQDRQDGIEKETIEDEEAELLTDTTVTGDTTEKGATDIEADGLLPTQDLTKEVLEAEEAIEERRIETMTEETVVERDALMRREAEGVEEPAPGAEVKGLYILTGHRKEVILEPEAVKEERIEENQEEKDLDPDLPDPEATAEKTQKDLEAPAPTSAVKETKTVVPKEKTTIMPPVSTKEIVKFPRDLEIMLRIKAITRIKAESLLKTRMKTTSE